MSSATWKAWVSKRRQESSQRRKSALLTSESDGSSSAWPTPTGIHADRNNHDEPIENYEKRVEDYYSGKAKGKPGKSLGVAARMNWPTASARDWKDTPGMKSERTDSNRSRKADQLPRAVYNWPTPCAEDPRIGYQNRHTTKPSNINLPTRVRDGLPDPDNPNTNGNPRGQLNPDWVETLMGFPIGWSRIGSTDSGLSGTQSSQPSPSGPSGV